MKLLPYGADDETEWRTFVDAHPDRSMGHLLAMARLEEALSRARQRSLIVRDDANVLVGIVPLFEVERREFRAIRSRILTSGTHLPSGPLLAPSLGARQERVALELIADRLVEEAQRIGADAIRIAYPTVIGERPAVESLGVYPLRRYGFRESNIVALVADLRQSEEQLFAQLDAKARNLVKRSVRGGAEVRQIESREDWLACDDLNRSTLGGGAYSREELATIWDLVVAPGHATVTGVYVAGKPVSVVMVTLYGRASYYWFSFNAVPSPVPGTNTLGLWEGMRAAQRAGMAFFELGSLEFDDPKQIRIGRFKSQFGGRPVYTLSGIRQMRPGMRASGSTE